MPDILIRGMEIPSELTAVWVYPDGQTIVFKNNGDAKYRTKAIELPPHGDLIDRSDLKTNMIDDTFGSAACYVNLVQILDAPVIVPSNKEDT